jgi:LemA protein
MRIDEIVAIVWVAVMGFWMLGAYNRLVRLRQAIAAAFAQVDVQFRLRHDQLATLIEAAATELADMPEALATVDTARQQARVAADQAAQRSASAGHLASLALAEQVLRNAVSALIALVRARPALRSDERLRAAMKQLSATQHRLGAASEAFNTEVAKYNRGVQQFPTRLIAGMLGFRTTGTL